MPRVDQPTQPPRQRLLDLSQRLHATAQHVRVVEQDLFAGQLSPELPQQCVVRSRRRSTQVAPTAPVTTTASRRAATRSRHPRATAARCHATGVDTTAPTTVSNALASYVGPAAVTLTATDDRTVKATYYRLDSGATQTLSGGAVLIAAPASGVHRLTRWSSGRRLGRQHGDSPHDCVPHRVDRLPRLR